MEPPRRPEGNRHLSLIDITLGIGPRSVAWAGLAPPRLQWDARIDSGAAVNVGHLDCSLHTGTHADAPFHVGGPGATIEQLDISLYVGPCTVLRVADTGAIGRASLEAACEAANLVGALGAAGGAGRLGANGGRWLSPRVLVATGAPYDGRSFPSSAPFFEATAVDWLLGLGTRLIGIDGPSVDPLDSKTLAAHHLMFEAGGGVLENLRLEDVTAGAFTLMAAPVLVEGADAAPVRALLEVS